jgi:hypothetical protein
LTQSELWVPKCHHEFYFIFACVYDNQKILSRF